MLRKMANSDQPVPEKSEEPKETAPAADVEKQSSTDGEEPKETAPSADVEKQSSTDGVSSILRREKREVFLSRGCLALRGLGLLFSFLSFIIMASNMHGDWMNFNEYEEYGYCLAIAILSTLYTGGQVIRQLHELSTGKSLFSVRASNTLDFTGDQIMAYLLISAASSAIPLTTRMREESDNVFTDSSSAAIAMVFLAFISVALSALITGLKLSTQTYV